MGFVGHWWILGLLIVVLIIFGPGKLPQIGGAVGQAIKEFRKATTELKDEVARSTATEAEKPAVTSAAPAPDQAAGAAYPMPEPAVKERPEPPKA